MLDKKILNPKVCKNDVQRFHSSKDFWFFNLLEVGKVPNIIQLGSRFPPPSPALFFRFILYLNSFCFYTLKGCLWKIARRVSYPSIWCLMCRNSAVILTKNAFLTSFFYKKSEICLNFVLSNGAKSFPRQSFPPPPGLFPADFSLLGLFLARSFPH